MGHILVEQKPLVFCINHIPRDDTDDQMEISQFTSIEID